MKITICKDERSFDVAAAWKIIGQLLEKPDAVIGLSTGATTINMHDIIAAIHVSYPFDVSRVTFFNVDEFINVPADYDGDGKADVAVFRRSDGIWYVVPSTTGVPYGIEWGDAADIPIFKHQ